VQEVSMQNPFKVVEMFEEAIAEYCGSKYAVACDSATNALTMCCDYFKVEDVWIPKHTYVSVPQSIINAGGKAFFLDDDDWQLKGLYQLYPYPIWDSARLLTSGMHQRGQFECLSLHWGKTLNLGQGGVILTDSKEAADYFKKARWDGRTAGVAPKDDEINFIGRHCPMSPRDAADALTRLHFLPKHNKPLPEEKGYADLSTFKVFK
jgi:dTDP-4-amino-4,6-dideoxygalactose transaminase